MAKWDEDTTLKFVKLYRDEECLWNTSLNNYKNKSARESALLRIVKEMNISDFGVAEAKNKIKNLRSTYSQELIKIKKSEHSGIGTQERYKPKITWFAVMHLLMKIIEKKCESYNNMNDGEPHGEAKSQMHQEESQWQESQTQEESLVQEERDMQEESRQGRKNRLCKNQLNKQTHATIPGSVPKCRKLLNSRVKEVASCVSELKNLAGSLINVEDEQDDEFKLFGLSVAAQLKKIPLEDAVLAQGEIQALLTRYRLKSMKQSNLRTEIPLKRRF